LIYNKFFMCNIQYPIFDCLKYITLHILEQKINVSSSLRGNYLLNTDYIIMLELRKKAYLAIDSLSISFILKGKKYFFNSEYLFTFFTFNFPDMSVCSTSYFLDDFETILYFLLKKVMLTSSFLLLTWFFSIHDFYPKGNGNYNINRREKSRSKIIVIFFIMIFNYQLEKKQENWLISLTFYRKAIKMGKNNNNSY
jgi:hypothetical protein